MRHWRQRRLALAVVLSLLLHLLLLDAPGWQAAPPDDATDSDSLMQIDAHLAPLAVPVAPSARPAAPRSKPRRRPAPLPVAPAAPLPPPALADASTQRLPAPPVEVPVEVPAALQNLLKDEPPRPPDLDVQPEFALPRRGSIHFVVSRGERGFVIGESLQRWSHDGKAYTLSNQSETTGLVALFRPVRVTQTSEGEISGEGLRPRLFRVERNGFAGEAASFDWAAMRLALSAGNGNSREVALNGGAQDMLSMFYQFGAALSGLPGASQQVMVATGKKFERYAFDMVGEEILSTRQGEFRTRHLRAAAGVEVIDLWLALDLRGLPLRIRYTDRQGESYDQIADRIDFEGMPGAAGGR